MRFARSLFNLTLVAVGGILGNLLAAWVQQDAWGNVFTPLRLALTLAGCVLVVVLLAWLDARGNAGASAAAGVSPPSGVGHNRQVGIQNVIRVLAGTNAVGNWQVGSGNRIEAIDAALPDRDHRLALQRQLADKKAQLALLDEQLAGYSPDAKPAAKLLQAQNVREDIRRIEKELDRL